MNGGWDYSDYSNHGKSIPSPHPILQLAKTTMAPAVAEAPPDSVPELGWREIVFVKQWQINHIFDGL